MNKEKNNMFMDEGNPSSAAPKSNDIDDFFVGLEAEIAPANPGQEGVPLNNAADADINFLNEVDEAIAPKKPTQNEPANPGGEVDYKKRYEDSSVEARKMRDRLDTLEPFSPILKAMREDKGLTEHVKSYFTPQADSGEAMANIAKELDEDFDFSMKEAIANPQSKDAEILRKVNRAMNEPLVDSKVRDSQIQRERDDSLREQRRFLTDKYNMTDNSIEELIDWSKNQEVTLEDVLFLRKRQDYLNNVNKQSKNNLASQMNNMRNVPTMSPQGDGAYDEEPTVSPEDAMFNLLLKEELGGSIFNPK